jgi:hypothetical protein
MNTHYQLALDGLKSLDAMHASGTPVTEASALAKVAIQASLAATKATEELLKAQETANLISYAALCREFRSHSTAIAARELADVAMASHPGIREAQDEDSDD